MFVISQMRKVIAREISCLAIGPTARKRGKAFKLRSDTKDPTISMELSTSNINLFLSPLCKHQ